jgi:Mg-chelatase subunit ChlD
MPLGFVKFVKAQSVGGGGTKENLDLPFDALGQAEDEEDAPEIVTFYGQQLEGDGFFYVIDRSGSMNDSGELNIAKREVVRNVSEFSERVQFGIIFFAADALKFPSSGQPADASPGMKQAAINFTNSTPWAHQSCVQKGMAAILQMANQSTSKRKVIVYVGDGGGTCGGDEATYLRQCVTLVGSLNYQRIQINTIGVLQQQPINEAFMKQLATSNGGTFTRVMR